MEDNGPGAKSFPAKAVYFNITVKTAIIGLLLFAFRGSLLWEAGWAYLWLYAVWIFINTALLRRKNPELLLRRLMLAPDPAPGQDRYFARSNPVLGGAMLAVSAYYPHWPEGGYWLWARVLAFAGLAAAYWGVTWTMLSNAFALKAVLVQPGQTPVRAGPYAFVRHPFYAAFLLACACTPAALGSLYGILPALMAGMGVVTHTSFEDGFLTEKLAGYKEYAAAVKWKLVPWIW
ncbi:MAG: hypothetical protein NTY45_03505 [Elusimicrobia bacterium]|nr:hypothetical protein [Elusimicrobiota bacterium]